MGIETPTPGDASSYFHSRDHSGCGFNGPMETPNRHASSNKTKRNLSSISFMENIPLLKVMNSKLTKKNLDLKARSVSRSFSRRKNGMGAHHQTLQPETGSTSQKSSLTGFSKHRHNQSQGASGGLYCKSREKAYLNMHTKSSKKSSVSTRNPIQIQLQSTQEEYLSKELMALNALYNARNYEGLLQTVTLAFQKNPKLMSNPNIHFLIAMSYYKVNDFTNSRDHFLKLLQLKERYKKSAYIFLAICYNNLKEVDEAMNTLERALILYPNFYEARVGCFDCFRSTKPSC